LEGVFFSTHSAAGYFDLRWKLFNAQEKSFLFGWYILLTSLYICLEYEESVFPHFVTHRRETFRNLGNLFSFCP